MEWPNTGTCGTIIPDTQCYNIALAAAVKAKGNDGIDAALSLFNSMREPSQSGSLPAKDLISFNTIIGALTKAGRSEHAFLMFDRMRRSNVKPDKYTYTSLIKACVKEGDSQELLVDMKEQGVQPDVVTYNTMIRSLCDRFQFSEAKKLVTEMESRGIPPDSMTYGLLMNGLIKAKKPSTCLTLFETACADRRTAPLMENVHLYTTAIAASVGNHERALDLVSRMNIAGIKPNLKTMTALMSACLSSGKPELAIDVYSRIANPDGYAMLIAIRAMCANGDLSSASNLLAPQRSGRVAMSGKQVMESFHVLIRSSLELGDYAMARQSFVSDA
jgi:pentatricopeptide repeat protein